MVSTKQSKETRTPSEPQNAPHIATLVIGDTLAFLIFAAIGRSSHGETAGLASIPQIVLTAVPFAAAWFIVAPFVGAYRRELTAQPRKMAIRTILAWVLSWPLAMVLRGLFVDHAVPPVSFALITLIFNTFILLVWRWPYALNNSIKKRERASNQ